MGEQPLEYGKCWRPKGSFLPWGWQTGHLFGLFFCCGCQRGRASLSWHIFFSFLWGGLGDGNISGVLKLNAGLWGNKDRCCKTEVKLLRKKHHQVLSLPTWVTLLIGFSTAIMVGSGFRRLCFKIKGSLQRDCYCVVREGRLLSLPPLPLFAPATPCPMGFYL